MIVLNLQCASGHGFEGWFASVAAFDDQNGRHLVTCPRCGDVSVSRLPSGPAVVTRGREAPPRENQPPAATATPEALFRAWLESAARSEDVGERFAEESRKIHYGDAPVRDIRGKASLSEARDLLEEGITVLPLPLPDKKDTH